MSISRDIPDMGLLIPSGHAAFIAAIPHFQVYVLIPKRKQTLFPVQFFNFLGHVQSAFGGYTTVGEASGSWLDKAAGIEYPDTHTVISIAIPNERSAFQVLEALIARTAFTLKEQAIFLSISGGPTYFVWAALPAATEGNFLLPCSPLIH